MIVFIVLEVISFFLGLILYPLWPLPVPEYF